MPEDQRLEIALPALLRWPRPELRELVQVPSGLLGFAQEAADGTLLPPPLPHEERKKKVLLQNWLESWHQPLRNRFRAAGVKEELSRVVAFAFGTP